MLERVSEISRSNTIKTLQTMSQDPYKLLTDSIKMLNEPVSELMDIHNEFMTTNLSALNNIKSLNNFQLLLNHRINQSESEDSNPRKRANEEE